jgi:hypothetical protein
MNISRAQFRSHELSFRQRWSNYLVIFFSLITLFGGLNLRDQSLHATSTYSNVEAGIHALYPYNWLIDNEGEYIFRVRDMSNIGFKTTIQVNIQATGQNATARNIADAITLNRSQTLAVYNVLDINNRFLLPDETTATAISYTYAAIDPDPFLQSIPIVVQGLDILSTKRGQAIIISFIADANTFATDYPIFERFLATLEF